MGEDGGIDDQNNKFRFSHMYKKVRNRSSNILILSIAPS